MKMAASIPTMFSFILDHRTSTGINARCFFSSSCAVLAVIVNGAGGPSIDLTGLENKAVFPWRGK